MRRLVAFLVKAVVGYFKWIEKHPVIVGLFLIVFGIAYTVLPLFPIITGRTLPELITGHIIVRSYEELLYPSILMMAMGLFCLVSGFLILYGARKKRKDEKALVTDMDNDNEK